MLERDRPDEAAAALEDYSGPEPPPLMHAVLLDAWARVQIERRRFAAASEAFVRSGALQVACAVPGPQFIAWRTGAARAYAALGQADRARDLAGEALALARHADAPRAIGSALRASALIASNPERARLLSEAVAVLETSEARLEHAHALCELGTALRQERSSKAAREPLRIGLDLAVRCGATALAKHAHAELLAAGARPRRVTISGRDALTPAEARTGQLAADGLTNREIAQTLFVTTKTVETQLARAYQKLAIHSRRELAGALETGASPGL
jgi:DNA-binding CsgD family transcriptional regulator